MVARLQNTRCLAFELFLLLILHARSGGEREGKGGGDKLNWGLRDAFESVKSRM